MKEFATKIGVVVLRSFSYFAGVALLLLVTFLCFRVPAGAGFAAMWNGAIGNPKDGFWYPLSETFVETAPLLLTGLGVVVAWRAGLFSIGAEGQLLMGAAAATGVLTIAGKAPSLILIPLMLLVGTLAGCGWSAIAGWLRVKRNVPEVISTIMLNYIALSLVTWLVLGPLHGKGQSGPYSSPMTKEQMFYRPIPVSISEVQTRFHIGVILSFLIVPIVIVVLNRTSWGFGIRLLGKNEEAARVAKFPIDQLRMGAMALSGGLCGLAGTIELLGVNGRLGSDFSGGWGYTAIPVALLGGLNPIGALFSALFFGGLAAACGNAERQQGVGVPSVVSYVIQAVIVLSIVGIKAWRTRKSESEEN